MEVGVLAWLMETVAAAQLVVVVPPVPASEVTGLPHIWPAIQLVLIWVHRHQLIYSARTAPPLLRTGAKR